MRARLDRMTLAGMNLPTDSGGTQEQRIGSTVNWTALQTVARDMASRITDQRLRTLVVIAELRR
jgi:hypothetical protein